MFVCGTALDGDEVFCEEEVAVQAQTTELYDGSVTHAAADDNTSPVAGSYQVRFPFKRNRLLCVA